MSGTRKGRLHYIWPNNRKIHVEDYDENGVTDIYSSADRKSVV